MGKSNTSSSTNPGGAAGDGDIGGRQAETGAGKLADPSPAAPEHASRQSNKEFLKKNAATLLRREHVTVSDMEEPGEPVKRAGPQKSRKK